MTEFNKYPTTELGVYGNGHETVFVNKHGKAFLIQSPDMPAGTDAIKIDNFLPVDMVALGERDCLDLVIPDWVYESNDQTETLANLKAAAERELANVPAGTAKEDWPPYVAAALAYWTAKGDACREEIKKWQNASHAIYNP